MIIVEDLDSRSQRHLQKHVSMVGGQLWLSRWVHVVNGYFIFFLPTELAQVSAVGLSTSGRMLVSAGLPDFVSHQGMFFFPCWIDLRIWSWLLVCVTHNLTLECPTTNTRCRPQSTWLSCMPGILKQTASMQYGQFFLLFFCFIFPPLIYSSPALHRVLHITWLLCKL